MPEVFETSAKFPPPRLWYSRFVSVGRPLGPQLTAIPFHRQLAPFAWLGRRGQVESQVVRDEEIEPAVAIVIHEGATRAPPDARCGQPRPRSRILESAAAIPVEHVLAVVGEEQVGPAVVVVITGAYARCPSGAPQARGLGHILESPVSLVAIQAVGGRGAGSVRDFLARAFLQPCAAERQRIEPPVVVVIDERHARAVGLDDEPLAIDAAIDHRVPKTRALGDIGELHAPRGRV